MPSGNTLLTIISTIEWRSTNAHGILVTLFLTVITWRQVPHFTDGKAHTHRSSGTHLHPTQTNVGAGIQTSTHRLPEKPMVHPYLPPRNKTITCDNLCRKYPTSACLHIAMAHLKAFRINSFRSLRGSLIWLTNTPTVVTSPINNKCLMVTNPDHESAEHGVKQNHMRPDSKWDLPRPRVWLFNHHTAGLWAPTMTPPLITCKDFMKRSHQSHAAVLS